MTVPIRCFSNTIRPFQAKVPRFTKTLLAAGRAPLKSSQKIVRPFGFDHPLLLNHRDEGSFSVTGLIKLAFSNEAKERRQKNLDHEIAHSPFYESQSFINTKGKIFTAPQSYFKRDKSLYFPGFDAKTIAGENRGLYELLEGKVSIVRVFSTISGDKCSRSFFDTAEGSYLTDRFQEFKQKYPQSQILEINVPQSWIKGVFVNLSRSSIAKSMPQQLQDKSLLVPEHIFSGTVRLKLLCDNTSSGYIYLLDNEAHVRWAASGHASEEELAQLWRYVKALEAEI